MQDFAGLTRIQALHERARRGELQGRELELYSTVMRTYLDGLLAFQNRALQARHTPRRYLRIPRSVQVDVTAGETHRTLTLDCGLGGFATVLPAPAQPGADFTARLRIGPQELVNAIVRVADQRKLRGSARVSFAFVGMADRELERLEMFIRDAALSRSYWLLAPCPVPLVAAAVPQRAPPPRPASGGGECSFVLVASRRACAAPARPPPRVEPALRLACGDALPRPGARRDWW